MTNIAFLCGGIGIGGASFDCGASEAEVRPIRLLFLGPTPQLGEPLRLEPVIASM